MKELNSWDGELLCAACHGSTLHSLAAMSLSLAIGAEMSLRARQHLMIC